MPRSCMPISYIGCVYPTFISKVTHFVVTLLIKKDIFYTHSKFSFPAPISK